MIQEVHFGKYKYPLNVFRALVLHLVLIYGRYKICTEDWKKHLGKCHLQSKHNGGHKP